MESGDLDMDPATAAAELAALQTHRTALAGRAVQPWLTEDHVPTPSALGAE